MLYRGCEDDQLLYTFPLHVKFLNASWAHMMHHIDSDSQHVIIQIITRHSPDDEKKVFFEFPINACIFLLLLRTHYIFNKPPLITLTDLNKLHFLPKIKSTIEQVSFLIK